MALVSSVLASGLLAMVPTPVEATAITNFTNAWATYFAGVSVTGVPVGSLAAAKTQAGITAFWGVIVTSGPTLWVLTPSVITVVTPPPTLGGIAAALTAVFASNAADPTKTLAQATNAIAIVLHNNGGLGGIATVQPPPVAPSVPTPIL